MKAAGVRLVGSTRFYTKDEIPDSMVPTKVAEPAEGSADRKLFVGTTVSGHTPEAEMRRQSQRAGEKEDALLHGLHRIFA